MGEEATERRPPSRGRRIGRRVGQAIFFSVVIAITISATWQITQQVFFPTPHDTAVKVSSCEDGLKQLLNGIEAAKQAAARRDDDPNDEAPLNRFRLAISSSWAGRDKIGRMCQSTEHKRLLDAIDRLRYSEEHGVRKQAAELTTLRRRVGEMAAQVLHGESP